MRSVPNLNARAAVEQGEGGTAVVSVPLRRPGWLVPPVSWVVPFRTHRRIQLDMLGTAVLNMCDGKATVERIIAQFAERHRLSFREAQVCVVQFLRDLTQRGVLAIVSVKDGSVQS